jgi:hypothetical protein
MRVICTYPRRTRMEVRTGGEGERRRVVRKSIMALNAVWMGCRLRHPGLEDGESVYPPGKRAGKGVEGIPWALVGPG